MNIKTLMVMVLCNSIFTIKQNKLYTGIALCKRVVSNFCTKVANLTKPAEAKCACCHHAHHKTPFRRVYKTPFGRIDKTLFGRIYNRLKSTRINFKRTAASDIKIPTNVSAARLTKSFTHQGPATQFELQFARLSKIAHGRSYAINASNNYVQKAVDAMYARMISVFTPHVSLSMDTTRHFGFDWYTYALFLETFRDNHDYFTLRANLSAQYQNTVQDFLDYYSASYETVMATSSKFAEHTKLNSRLFTLISGVQMQTKIVAAHHEAWSLYKAARLLLQARAEVGDITSSDTHEVTLQQVTYYESESYSKFLHAQRDLESAQYELYRMLGFNLNVSELDEATLPRKIANAKIDNLMKRDDRFIQTLVRVKSAKKESEKKRVTFLVPEVAPILSLAYQYNEYGHFKQTLPVRLQLGVSVRYDIFNTRKMAEVILSNFTIASHEQQYYEQYNVTQQKAIQSLSVLRNNTEMINTLNRAIQASAEERGRLKSALDLDMLDQKSLQRYAAAAQQHADAMNNKLRYLHENTELYFGLSRPLPRLVQSLRLEKPYPKKNRRIKKRSRR